MDQLARRHPLPDPIPVRPTRDEYRRWAEGQRGRYERVRGEVVPMNAERLGHAMVKARVWQALDRAIKEAGLQAQALGDGITVEVGDDTDYEPDALVNLGPLPDLESIVAPNPVIVVEVASPGTRSVDTGRKLADYFKVRSVQHYLMVFHRTREVIHHARTGEGRTAAQLLTAGPLRLDPPGLAVTVDDFFVDLPD